MKKVLFIIIYTFIFAVLSSMVYKEYKKPDTDHKGGFNMAIINYSQTIDSLAHIFKISPNYLMALIMLESSGKKKVAVRFEKRIYKQLLLTQKGKISGFEQISAKTLASFSKKDLKKLACSYGPFQIMGYKSIELKIPLETLTGKNHLYWAIKWINSDYGTYVKNGDYKNAFHIHNAGTEYPDNGIPTTYDPEYVKNGLRYMKYFKNFYEKENTTKK